MLPHCKLTLFESAGVLSVIMYLFSAAEMKRFSSGESDTNNCHNTEKTIPMIPEGREKAMRIMLNSLANSSATKHLLGKTIAMQIAVKF